MRIHNVRMGFATNSSSTHSLVFLKPGMKVEDSEPDQSAFGWDYWTAASVRNKSNYLALTLYDSLRGVVHEDIAKAVVKQWTWPFESGSSRTAAESDGLWSDGYIDHQSSMSLPRSRSGVGIDKAFFDDFKRFLLRDDLVILGGNDNREEDGDHELGYLGKFNTPLPEDDSRSDLVARKDAAGFWTIFNRKSGLKIRFSFDDPRVEVRADKSSLPELVDVKITDYCKANCAYCYQDSSVEGKHATEDQIYKVSSLLRRMEVFEVALGGGEPTKHPKFWDIVKQFRAAGIVPNFTTRSLEWLLEPGVKYRLKDVGGFACSVSYPSDVETFARVLNRVEVVPYDGDRVDRSDGPQVNVQYVMGSSSLDAFEAVAAESFKNNFPLVLLGFKHTGRGSGYKPKPYVGWYDVLLKAADTASKDTYTLCKVGIDTALAAEIDSDPKLRERVRGSHMRGCAQQIFYTTIEGKHSMYIDAVEGSYGPSSYCDSLHMRKLQEGDWFSNEDYDKICEVYRKW